MPRISIGYFFLLSFLVFKVNTVVLVWKMNRYTTEEYCDMHYCYGMARGSARGAARLYAAHFPDRPCPNHQTFTAVHNRLRETGTFKVNMSDTGRDRSVRSVEFEEQVLNRFEDNPSVSSRVVGSELGCSKNTVWRVLKGENLYPYSPQKVQALQPEDYPRRVACARWFLEMDLNNPLFLGNVLFTDEAGFSREGIFNNRTSHVWAAENPHAIYEAGHQVKFSVNVWAGVIGNFLVGPYILPNRLNSPTYLVFLRDILPELLEDVPIQIRETMWFQHDGAPAHYGNVVQEYLNNTFQNRWIGRGGPTQWPARSPDLTPLDFFLWGNMKRLVYSTPVENEMDLVARVVEAAAIIKDDVPCFERVQRSMIDRFRLCNRVEGRHFEQLL